MPLRYFICPDGQQVEIITCLEKCRMANMLEGERCLSLRTLQAVSQEREWTGIPSTTQLLAGTRESYMKIVYDYAVNPIDRMFMLHGTHVHTALEKHSPEGSEAEIRLFDEHSSGQFDFYDNKTLFDNKVYGSYSVAKTLGIYKHKTPDGEYKNGKPKFKTVFVNGKKDRFNLALQLNDYRVKMEQHGYPVDRMMCEIIVRDGGTFIAKSRGILLNAYLVKINRISDQWVIRYMRKKSQALKYALANQQLPPPCKPRERWYSEGYSGKCAGYCDVRNICDVGIREQAMKNSLGGQDDSSEG